MTEQLAASPKLLQRLNRPVEETLSRLRSGMLFSEIGAPIPARESPRSKTPKEVEPPAR